MAGQANTAMAERRAGSRHDGFILVAVLAVMALLAGLVGAASLIVRATVNEAHIGADQLTDDALARAGVELAAYQLYTLNLPAASIDAQQVRLDTGIITLFVTPEAGKIDLNSADPVLLAGAWRAAGLSTLSPAVFAARVVDWRDEDNKPSYGGAEADAYRAAGLDHVPQNDVFRSTDELQWVLGLSPADVTALSPLLTVHNPGGKINLFDAPQTVLLALPDVTFSMVKHILSLRAERTKMIADKLAAVLPDQQNYVTIEPGHSYRVRVDTRRTDGSVTTIETVLTRGVREDAVYHVMNWAE